MKRTKTLSIQEDFPKNEFLCFRNHFIKIKNDLLITLIKNGKKKLYKYTNKEKNIKNIKNRVYDNNIIIRNYILITFIKFIIISIFYQIKCIILLDSFYFQYSKITLKIKGIGYNTILGNETGSNFKSIKYLKKFYSAK